MTPIITDDHINEIEKLLLPQGCSFNEERRTFIKCIGSRDVNACAGSGKTTALIAKLMILDRYYMPFSQNKGVCVLTHTNVAIDEVKEKLGANSKLLNHPNFFGTIQAFVDKFLAVPMYVKSFGKRPTRIDNDWYEDSLKSIGNYLLSDKNKKHLSAKGWLKNKNNPIETLTKIRFSLDNNSIKDLQLLEKFNGNELFKNKGKAFNDLYSIKYNTLFKDRGVLCFDDAYTLANLYIKEYKTQLKNLFANRFQFVFIDEMQDSYPHQIDIFNKIFDKQRIIYQCIGDPNQAIFNSEIADCAWKPHNALSISDSQRFSTKIANAIQNIRLDVTLPLVGNSNKQVLNDDGTRNEIKPYIIVFEDSQIQEVITEFKNLIIKHKLHIPETTGQKTEKIKFKAIGWVGKEKDSEITSSGQVKHIIKHYFSENTYKKESKTKENFDNLTDYLLKQELPEHEDDKKYSQSAKNYKDALINAFLKVLRIVVKKQDDGRYYNTTSFWQKVYSDKNFADNFLSKMAYWIKNIVQGNDIRDEVKSFICKELKDFFVYQNKTELTTFLNNPPKLLAIDNQKPKNYIEYESDNVKFKIDIATIHSVKGETHTGTLYLETSYHGYETNKVSGKVKDNTFLTFLKGNSRTNNFSDKIKDTLKMAYVGMSRPTHLLCFAIHNSNIFDFNEISKHFEIINLTTMIIPSIKNN
jgi:superfamily I DNA/RNA helicase